MADNNELLEHTEFRELAAVAASNDLTSAERIRLEDHLSTCEECREAYREYLLVAGEVIPMLAAQQKNVEGQEEWDEGPWRERLFRRIQEDKPKAATGGKWRFGFIPPVDFLPRVTTSGFLLTLAVAGICFILGGEILGHRWANQRPVVAGQGTNSTKDHSDADGEQTAQSMQRLHDETVRVEELETDRARQEQQLNKMRLDFKDISKRESELLASNGASSAQVKGLTEERDTLRDQISKAEESYASTETELSDLRRERDGALARNAELESKIEDLSVNLSNRERQIAEDEQFLNSDRDIRDLMGARQLYIADVFDVDSHSRTRPPFGRIFYTHGKSLIFYAFDLDNQKGAVTASAFQVWGKGTDVPTPLSLGILYLDNESNRRWLLRSDDAQQLAKIDSVFVTVEPKGGSRKPTGKPFLYALLRKEANHP